MWHCWFVSSACALMMFVLHFSRVSLVFCKVGRNPVALGKPTPCRYYQVAAVQQRPTLLKMDFLG